MGAWINELLADPPLRARLGASGYQKVMTRCTWEHVSRAVYGVYQQVLEQPVTR